MACSQVKVKVAQSCPTVCNPMDYIVHGIHQALFTKVGLNGMWNVNFVSGIDHSHKDTAPPAEEGLLRVSSKAGSDQALKKDQVTSVTCVFISN